MSHHLQAVERIARARAEHWTALDLGDLPLETLPKELADLTELQLLSLGKDVFTQQGQTLSSNEDSGRPTQRFITLSVLKPLHNLRELYLTGCKDLADVSALRHLGKLQKLKLHHCSALVDVSALGHLGNLRKLYLKDCNALSDVSVFRCLSNLREFILSECAALEDLSALGHLGKLREMCLIDCSALADVSALGSLANLRLLYLRGFNSLADASALGHLRNLRKLYLSDCCALTDVSELGQLSNLRSLALSDCDALADVSALGSLSNLRSLRLFGLKALTNLSALGSLTNLRELDVNYCTALTDVSTLDSLTNLRELRLGNCGALEDLSGLSRLSNLRRLYLTDCKALSDVSALRFLNKLRKLHLFGSDFLVGVSALGSLTNLRELQLPLCRALADVSAIGSLTNLRELDLSCCTALTDLSALASLTNLRSLDLGGCHALANVLPLGHLGNLRILKLDECEALADVSALRQLDKLLWLDLRGCSGLQQFHPLDNLLPHVLYLFLHGCHFTDLPSEVWGEKSDNVRDAVWQHYREGEAHGWRADDELKVFVLGNGGVGKTNLCARLRDQPFDEHSESTQGIELNELPIRLPSRPRPVRLKLWDFGGQDIYLGTHHLFLDKQAVFILVWTPDTEHGEYFETTSEARWRHRPLSYWFDYLRSVAGTADPVLVVQGRCDGDQCAKPLDTRANDFTDLQTLDFSALDDEPGRRKLDKLRDTLQKTAARLLKRTPQAEIPEGRARLAEVLRERRAERFMTWHDFELLCRDIGMGLHPRHAGEFLHRRGVVYCRPDLFDGRVILDQSWALKGVYRVFNAARKWPLAFPGGRFTQQHLASGVWQNYSPADQQTFLGMMETCGICFPAGCPDPERFPDERDYVAPVLLPERESAAVRERLAYESRQAGEPAETAGADFELLHEGILQRFLTWLGGHAGNAALYWKYGCWFYDPQSGAAVLVDVPAEAWQDGKRGTITLKSWGAAAKGWLNLCLDSLQNLSPLRPPTVTWERRVVPDSVCAASAFDLLAKEYPRMSAKERFQLGEQIRVVHLIRQIFREREAEVLKAQELAETLGKTYNYSRSDRHLRSCLKTVQELVTKRFGGKKVRLFTPLKGLGFQIELAVSWDPRVERAWTWIAEVAEAPLPFLATSRSGIDRT